MRNFGYKKAPIESKHFLGNVLPKEVIFPDGHGWADYLPKTEIQRNSNFDSNSCTAYGSNHALSILMQKKYGGDQDLSERFVAILGNLAPPENGGDPHEIAETIRKNGEIPETELPFDSTIQTAKDYFSPNPMTQDHLFSGQNWLSKYSYGHEWVLSSNTMQPASVYAPLFKEALKYGPCGLAVYAWNTRNGLYYRPDGIPDTHWVTLFDWVENSHWIIFDSYDGFVKKLEWNFGFERCKRYHVEQKTVNEQKVSLIQRLLNTISRLLGLLKTVQPPVNGNNKIQQLVAAMANVETKNLDKSTLGIRNNNPLNLRWAGQNHAVNNKGFCKFDTMKSGWQAAYFQISIICNGTSLAYTQAARKLGVLNCGQLSILQFISIFAPVSDGNFPMAYTQRVCKETGFKQSMLMRELL